MGTGATRIMPTTGAEEEEVVGTGTGIGENERGYAETLSQMPNAYRRVTASGNRPIRLISNFSTYEA